VPEYRCVKVQQNVCIIITTRILLGVKILISSCSCSRNVFSPVNHCFQLLCLELFRATCSLHFFWRSEISYYKLNICFFSMAQQPLVGKGFLIIGASRLHSHTILDKAPLDEGSARHRDLYLTTHNTHKRQISITPAGFVPAVPTSERPHTHPLDHEATGIGTEYLWLVTSNFIIQCVFLNFY
jgi:hypothetical protein